MSLARLSTTDGSCFQVQASSILFLSDNTKEVDAAIAAGMSSLVVDRPGNAALSDEDNQRLTVVTALDQVANAV